MRRVRWLPLFSAAAAALTIASAIVGAQVPRQRVQVETRGDVIAAKWTAVEGGLGFSIPSGHDVRSGAVVAAGGGARGFESRLDLFSRFTIDPFRQSRWGLYAGGGLSGRYAQEDFPHTHGYLLAFAGAEGPIVGGDASGWVPAIEVGLGGGTRAAFILRRGIRGRR